MHPSASGFFFQRRRLVLGAAMAPLGGLTGCAAFNYAQPDAPAALATVTPLQPRPRIAPEVAQADFLIHPELDCWACPSRRYFLDARARGEAHARAILPQLLAQLHSRGVLA